MVEDLDDFLEHHGIKGMKWGVRRKSKDAVKAARTVYKKPAKHLSDAELNKRIKRLELEKKYRELNNTKTFDGKKYAQSLLENSGKTLTGAAIGGTGTFFIQKALKAKFGN